MTTKQTTYPPYVGVGTASEMMGGRGESRIYELISRGAIDSVKEGKRRLVVTASVYAYLESLEHSQSNEVRGAAGDNVKTERG